MFTVPTDPATFKPVFQSYAGSAWMVPFVPKVVLVDGRFRVACVLATILRWGRSPIIVLHDYVERRQYDAVLPFIDIIFDPRDPTRNPQLQRASLVFRARRDLDKTLLRAEYEKFTTVPE